MAPPAGIAHPSGPTESRASRFLLPASATPPTATVCSAFQLNGNGFPPFPPRNKCQHGWEPSALYLISEQNNPDLTIVPKVDKVS